MIKNDLTLPYAPIALFVYNRLWHTQQTIQALQNNTLAPESELFIFSDGPKNAASEHSVFEIRQWLKTLSGFKKIVIIEREKNIGLAQSIISGVTEIVEQYGNIIVMEDDLVVSEYFLQYMNDGLTLYQDESRVASIHGYALPLKQQMPDTYFLRGADCWGWATWQRAWAHFEPDGTKLLGLLEKNGAQEFDFLGTQPNIQMLKDQIEGKNNSWAIRWHASAFINNMLTLYPKHSLVKNIGFDNTGEHCVSTSLFDVELTHSPMPLSSIPIEPSKLAYDAYVQFFKQAHMPLHKRIVRKLKQRYTAFLNPDPESKVLLNYVKQFVSKNADILDVGCGYGRYLRPLQKLGYNVLGIDKNVHIVEKNRKEGLNAISVDKFEKSDATFDAIICSHIIEHFNPSDLLNFLNYYLDRLKIGGVLIIATPLFSDGFYNDFDHVKPYQPTGLQMVFGGNNPQVQYCSYHTLGLSDIWFRKRPFSTFFYKAKYLKSCCSKFFQLYDFTMALLFRISFGFIGKKDAWVGVFTKL